MARDAIDGKLYGTGFGKPLAPPGQGALKQRLIIPPFSVLNTRDAVWIQRRRAWIRLGIQSEVGRDAAAYPGQDNLNRLMSSVKRTDPGGGGGPNSIYRRNGSTKLATQESLGAGIRKDTATNPGGGGGGANSVWLHRRVEGPDGGGIATGTSIFDPVLCELAYTWWCPPAGIVVDPFAGGSVRGIVASVLGLRYWGCDLRAEQIEANRGQLGPATTGQYKPRWVCGDSLVEMPKAPLADFALSCPPYGNLEQYSDDPADISNHDYAGFLASYREIIAKTAARLKPDRYAVLVVGNYRDRKDGRMIDLVGDTVRACGDAGLVFFNDIILVNSVGTAAMRANTSFARGARKVVKVHQNVLVFTKGDPKRAAAAVGPPVDGKG